MTKQITLDTICNGAAPKLFDKMLKEVLKDIADEERSHKATREITLSFKIKPNNNRGFGQVTLTGKTKLSGREIDGNALVFKIAGDELKAFAGDEQQALFDNEGNVKQIGRKVK